MSRFENLLSHQGPLTHVNHSHRREAPTGRYTFDPITGEPRELQSEIFDEPPPQLMPQDIAVNNQVILSKGQALTALLARLRRMEPKTEFLESEIRWAQSEIDRATQQRNAHTNH